MPPVMLVHQVPPKFNPGDPAFDDIKEATLLAQRTALLIERGTDPTYADGNTYYNKQYMIRLTNTSGTTYGLDMVYHNVANTNFANTASYEFLTDTAWNNITTPRRSFAPPGTDGNPPFLEFQVFIEKPVNYSGYTPTSRQENFTFIPQQGGYSVNIGGNTTTVQPDTNYIGRQYNAAWAHPDVGGSPTLFTGQYEHLNYTIDAANKTITFKPLYHTSYISGYNVYIRCYFVRTANTKSSVYSSANYRYFALPYTDLVNNTDPGYEPPSSLTGSINGSTIPLEVNGDSGIVIIDDDDFQDGYPVIIADDYQYHQWDRLSNDDLMNSQLHNLWDGEVYSGGGAVSGDKEPIPLHQDSLAVGTDGRWYWAWNDIKITNDGSDTWHELWIQFLLRGRTSGGIDEEEIIPGASGLLDANRPWDHHEGVRDETSLACFARVSRGYAWYGTAGERAESTATLALAIQKWYNSSFDNGQIKMFRVEGLGSTDLTRTAQLEGDSVVDLGPGDRIYARILHSLRDPDATGTSMIKNVTTGLKAWTMTVRGWYEI